MSACHFPEKQENGVEFVMGSSLDLFGFKNNGDPREFLSETFLAEYGYLFCKPSDAFYLRFAYLGQPLDELVCIGMNPIYDSRSDPRLFCLEHGSGGMWLYAYYAFPVKKRPPDTLWIFRLKKVAQS